MLRGHWPTQVIWMQFCLQNYISRRFVCCEYQPAEGFFLISVKSGDPSQLCHPFVCQNYVLSPWWCGWKKEPVFKDSPLRCVQGHYDIQDFREKSQKAKKEELKKAIVLKFFIMFKPLILSICFKSSCKGQFLSLCSCFYVLFGYSQAFVVNKIPPSSVLKHWFVPVVNSCNLIKKG